VIEGDHGSAYVHPDNPSAHAVIECQVTPQRRAGGNALYRTTEADGGRRRPTDADGVFCYTFLKGVGEKGATERARH
jgi:hypothetical protein